MPPELAAATTATFIKWDKTFNGSIDSTYELPDAIADMAAIACVPPIDSCELEAIVTEMVSTYKGREVKEIVTKQEVRHYCLLPICMSCSSGAGGLRGVLRDCISFSCPEPGRLFCRMWTKPGKEQATFR